jgi:hypothetical protein
MARVTAFEAQVSEDVQGVVFSFFKTKMQLSDNQFIEFYGTTVANGLSVKLITDCTPKTTKTMKTSSLSLTLAKEVAIVLTCLLLGLAGTAFAGGEGGHKNNKSNRELSKEEVELFKAIDSTYRREMQEALESIDHPPSAFDRVEIYDASGNLLKALDLNGKPFSEVYLLPHAELLAIVDRVALYMVP